MAKGKDVVEGAAKGVEVAATKGKKAAKGALGAVTGALGGIAAKATDLAQDAAEAAKNTAEGALETAKGAVETVVDKVGDAAEGAVDKAKELVGDLPGGIADAAQGAMDKVTDVASGAVDAAKDAVSNVADAAGGVVDGAVDLAQDAASGAVDLAKGAIDKVGGLGAGALGAGAAALGGAAAVAGGVGKGATDAAAQGVAAVGGLVDDKKGGGFLIPLLLVAGILALAWFGFKDYAGKEKAPEAAVTAPAADAPVDAALKALPANPDVAACAKAFTDTMAGRTINFTTGNAAISTESDALLAALTGIASGCKAHKIEVAGHTDARGDAAANQTLSQARADAVKAIWVAKGVPSAGLTAVGYGATKPLDPATTEEAYAKNRRTEFSVQ